MSFASGGRPATEIRVNPTGTIVYIVDDDCDVRSSLSFMLEHAGRPIRAFASGRDFIDSLDRLKPGCVLLDVRMADMDGVAVLKEMKRRDISWPAIIMTGHGQVALAVQMMKLGAMEFLEKPFEPDVLDACLDRGVALLEQQAAAMERTRDAKSRIERLTDRERDVLRALIEGLPNKLIAHRFGISMRTVEMHRANLMHNLGVKSLAHALRVAFDARFDQPSETQLPPRT
jgi:two-component system response regulator FixJ